MNLPKQQNFVLRFWSGFGAFWQGFQFMGKHRLWPYVLLPSLLSVVLGLLLLAGVYTGVSEGILQLWHGRGVWAELYETGVSLLAGAIALFATLVIYQFLGSLLIIPFLGPLLAQVEKILHGQAIEVSLFKDFQNAFVGIWIGIRDLFLQIFCLFISLLLGPLQPVLMITVTSHFLGRSSFDFLLEKHTQTLKERQAKTKTWWLEIQGLGLAEFLLLLIPIVGIFVVPASGLVGAALLFYQSSDQHQKTP
ncbi:MAG: EI24 domain-containing protein [Aphanocapsa sp. GSE-SYN-MK-11-07L]|jgi:CysZ protein|nr:EI24 domain-containing protein [Aphanocapsa sp. GSE-SYN-MK-11-07L]